MSKRPKAPKVWFIPDGAGSWEVLASDRALNEILWNQEDREEVLFEAAVPSLHQPDHAKILDGVRCAFSKRKERMLSLTAVLFSICFLGFVTGCIGMIYHLWMFAFVLAAIVSGYWGMRRVTLSNGSGQMSTLDSIPYDISYRMFLEEMGNVMEGQASVRAVVQSHYEEAEHLSSMLHDRMPEGLSEEARKAYLALMRITDA